MFKSVVLLCALYSLSAQNAFAFEVGPNLKLIKECAITGKKDLETRITKNEPVFKVLEASALAGITQANFKRKK